jgi:hypothetical protein
MFLPKEFRDRINNDIERYIYEIETRGWQSFTLWEYLAVKKMKTPPTPPAPPVIAPTPPVDFVFLGEKGGRKDNFDADIKVTKDNIDTLYRHYDVSQILEYQDTSYYKIAPKKLYSEARWFSRLVQMVNGSQTAAVTFYDYSITFVDILDDNLLIGLGSLKISLPNTPSNFNCKAIILDKNLNQSFEKICHYFDYKYTFIDTMYLTNDGFYMEVININVNVNSTGDSCYNYAVWFDKTGDISESTKNKRDSRTVKIK